MGTKKPETPRRSPRTPKRTATPAKSTSKPHPTKTSKSPATPRVIRRASDFTTKKSSAKKRKRESSRPVAKVDELVRGVKELVKAEESEQAKQLHNALKKAKRQFESDESASDSSDEEMETQIKDIGKKGKAQTDKRKKIQEGKGDEDMVTPKTKGKKAGKDVEKISENKFVTPAKPPLPSRRKSMASAKRSRVAESVGKKDVGKSKTASAHKRDIEALKKEDPNFYKFLEENEADLIDFDLEEDLIGYSDEEEQDEQVEEGDQAGKGADEIVKVEKKPEQKGNVTKMVVEGNNLDSEEDEEDEEVEENEDKGTEKGEEDVEAKEGKSTMMESEQIVNKGVAEGYESHSEQGGEESESGIESKPNGQERLKDVRNDSKTLASHVDENDNSDSGSPGQGANIEEDEEEESSVESEEDKDEKNKQVGEPTSKNGDVTLANSSGSDSEVDSKLEMRERALENPNVQVDDGKEDLSSEPNSDHESESDEEEQERLEEMRAAAEAGLALGADNENAVNVDSDEDADSEDDGPPTKKQKKSILVDTAYLRSIKERLARKRTCLNAAKDLLRLLRAGRDILPSQTVRPDKKAKMKKQKSRRSNNDGGLPSGNDDADITGDEFGDDGSFTSGKVKFVSAKVYQNAMNLSITGIQDALDHILGKPKSKKGSSEARLSKWDPTESSRWPNLQPVFRPYVFHMLALCDAMADPETLRFLLKRLEKLVPYTRDNKLLLKKIIRIAVRVWSSDSLHMSEATRLRAYLLLNRLAHGPGNAEAVLRSCCAVFASQIAKVCNPRTLPLIHFAATCIVELFGVDMGASYTTAFANLRELAVSLRAVLVSKDEKEIERVHNWSFINNLRLWSMVLSRYGSEDELRPLIYPYVQISLGVMRVQATPKTFPLRLHIASYLSDLVAATGIYIPVSPHILTLLRCSELRKKPERGKAKALEWRSTLRVPGDVVKTKPFLTAVIEGVILQIAKFFAAISKHVSFPELSHSVQTTLKKFAKEVHVSEWKRKLLALVEKVRQTSDLITDARGKADFTPQGAVSPEGMLGTVPGIDRDMKTPIQRFYEVERARVEKEQKLRDETTTAKKKADEKEEDMDKAHEGGTSDSEDNVDELAMRAKVTKKRKLAKGKGSKRNGVLSLSVPQMSDDDDDVIEELNVDYDGSSDEQ